MVMLVMWTVVMVAVVIKSFFFKEFIDDVNIKVIKSVCLLSKKLQIYVALD